MASTALALKQNLTKLEETYRARQKKKSYTYANRTKTKKSIATKKKQIGLYESIPFESNVLHGVHVDDSSFKYTVDEDRKNSVKLMYPFFPDLVRIPFMIDWASYNYKGPSILLFSDYNENTNSQSNNFLTADVDVSYLKSKTPFKKDCFFFFGGGAYEILNHAIKQDRLLVGTDTDMNYVTEFEIPFLHDLVDPTGDVDIRVRRPYVTVTHSDADDDPYDYDFTDETQTTLNQWVLHWVNWLYDNVVTIFKSSITRKGILPQTESFDLMENNEIAGGTVLRSERIDNVYVVLLQKDTMVKVQIVMKLKEVSESDHYFEMVIALQKNHFNTSNTTNTTTIDRLQRLQHAEELPDYINKLDYQSRGFELASMNLPNVRIQSFYSLVDENRDSIENRFRLAISPARHKFYNHVQRLVYLNQIFPYFVVGSEEFGLARNDPRRYKLSKERERELAKKPYLTDITNTSVLASFQRLFKTLKTFDDPYGVRGLLGNNVTPVNPICLFDYRRVGEHCTLDQIETLLFGNMIPIFSKMLQSTEKGTYKNLNRFTKRNVAPKKSEEKPVYAPMVLTHGRSDRKTRRRLRRN